MAWVTSLPVSQDNVAEIVACGRARWKIENESFNVLKNHGYELEHNFGPGQKFLAMTLAALNLLAFAWHTVLDLLEPPGTPRAKPPPSEPASSLISSCSAPTSSFPPGPPSSNHSRPSRSRPNS
jgi:hypothetical protein